MNLRMKIPNKLVDTSGMFTIETVIIFWTIFLMILVVFSHLGWEYQKAYSTQILHRELTIQSDLDNYVNKAQIEITSPILGSNDTFSATVRRRWDQVHLTERLIWLKTIKDVYEKVNEDE